MSTNIITDERLLCLNIKLLLISKVEFRRKVTQSSFHKKMQLIEKLKSLLLSFEESVSISGEVKDVKSSDKLI